MQVDPLAAPADRDFVAEYASLAPLALALERSLECQILSRYAFERPVLDLGCGDGCFVEVLFGRGCHIEHGLDPDPTELERARRRGVYGRLHQAYGDAIPLADASVATVITNSTLEHIPDLDPVLREMRRVVVPGGSVFASVPTHLFDRYAFASRTLEAFGLRSLAARFRRFYDRFWRHYHFYPPSEWVARFEAAGFRVVEVVEYGSPTRCTIHDLLVPPALPAYLVKRARGRYFMVPRLRRALVRAVRSLLPANRSETLPTGTGGLVFLRAVRPVAESPRPSDR